MAKKQTAKEERVKVTYEHLELINHGVYQSLLKREFRNTKVLNRVLRVCEYLKEEYKKFATLKDELSKRHAKKDDKGEIVLRNGNQYSIEDLRAYTEDLDSFLKEEVEIPVNRIEATLDDLPIAISGIELNFIKPILILKDDD